MYSAVSECLTLKLTWKKHLSKDWLSLPVIHQWKVGFELFLFEVLLEKDVGPRLQEAFFL